MESPNAETFPMMVVSVMTFLKLSMMTPHQQALKQGYVEMAAEDSVIVFVSHQWLAWEHPDPDGVQLQSLQQFLRRITAGAVGEVFSEADWITFAEGIGQDHRLHEEMERELTRMSRERLTEAKLSADISAASLWIDYFSVPQEPASKAAQCCAIDSIPAYIERSKFFVVVAPKAYHKDEQAFCNFTTWRKRGWCRLEEWANLLSVNMMMPIVVTERPKARVMDVLDFFLCRGITRAGAVGTGSFTCCTRGHVGSDRTPMSCDKEATMEVLSKMCFYKLRSLEEQGNMHALLFLRYCETTMFAQSDDEPFRAIWGTPDDDGSPPAVIGRIESDLAQGLPKTIDLMRIVSFLGDERLIQLCVERGYSVAEVDSQHGSTPLHHASCAGSSAALAYILSLPKSSRVINQATYNFRLTPLWWATRNGHRALVELLLQHHADVEVRRDTGEEPLHCAAQHGHASVARLLLAYRARVDSTSAAKNTPLHLAATGFTLWGDQDSKADIVKLLLDSRADAGARNHDGLTPLEVARQDSFEEAAVLLEPPRPDPEAARLCDDLQEALAEADRRRHEAQERLRTFEADTEMQEQGLKEELQSARDSTRAHRVQRHAFSQDRRTKKVMSEIREVESERDAMLQAAADLQSELSQVHRKAERDAKARATNVLQDELTQASRQAAHAAIVAVPDAAAIADAEATDAIERSLRTEVFSLRSALQFCERRSEDRASAHGNVAEAVSLRREQRHEEHQALEAAEEKLRAGRAALTDALALRQRSAWPSPQPGGSSPQFLREAGLQVEAHELACQDAQVELEELQEECSQLLRLNAAADERAEEFEERLAFGGLRATIDRAVALLDSDRAVVLMDRLVEQTHSQRPQRSEANRERENLRGAARLVLVLAQVCGTPRMTYLALDSNRSGRVSMSEFDSGLRLRIGLNYEAISRVERPALRKLFKEFDIQRKGFLTEQDFARTCPEVWADFGKGAQGRQGLLQPAAQDQEQEPEPIEQSGAGGAASAPNAGRGAVLRQS